jgi:hypothetical protein
VITLVEGAMFLELVAGLRPEHLPQAATRFLSTVGFMNRRRHRRLILVIAAAYAHADEWRTDHASLREGRLVPVKNAKGK